jgi:type I restriction enzyme S subunit
MISKKLCEISQVIMGQSPKGDSYNTDGVGMPLLNGAADYKGLSFNPKQYTDSPTRIAKKGDIILGIRATIGNFSITDKDYCIGRGVAAIRPNAKIVDKTYLLKRVESDLGKIIQKAAGSTIKGIKKEDLTDLLVPLPPLPEQKRIAEILDKADDLRQKNKQLLAAYDELLQATFLDMFGDPATNPKGWKEVMLDSIIQKIQIGPFGSQLHKSDYLENGIPLINPTNIKENKILFDDAVCISEAKYDSMPQYHLFDGDVVMARRGDLSKVALVKQNGGKMFCGTGSLYVRFSDELNKFFLFKMLSHEKTINFLEKEARGVTMPNLNKSIIKRIPIFLPPIALQNQFAQIVENIEAQKSVVKRSLQESEDLFNGLVQKAFGGDL